MELPYGISGGYYMLEKEPTPPSINKSEFYAKCKQIASIYHIKYEVLVMLSTIIGINDDTIVFVLS